jgi:tryptophanyl-tRNA synthetase
MSTTDSAEQHIDPWNVKGGAKGFDYLKLLNQFGTHPITPKIIERIERLTQMRVHRFLRRGIFFSQQYLEQLLDHYEAGKPIFLYTGRGPSSEAMHLGHMVPFEFTAYLQKAFQCILVVQMSDDEKFYFKGGDLDNYRRLTRENAKDIIACGFDPDRTYIFSNFDEIANGNPGLWRNVTELSHYTGVNTVRSTFGLNRLFVKNSEGEQEDSEKAGADPCSGMKAGADPCSGMKAGADPCSVGMMSWPVYQAAPCLASSFKRIFADIQNPDKNIFNFVPMAVDQAPYFRLMNDFCGSKNVLKPAQIHAEFLISLAGRNSKMSSTDNSTQPVYLTDTPAQIRKKVMKSFSGGGATLAEHNQFGADLMVDVPYQWLLLFLEDDEELKKIAHTYGPPKNDQVRMLTSAIKTIMCDCVVKYVEQHQKNRACVTEDVLNHYFNSNRKFNLEREHRDPIQLLSAEDYDGQGVNFDRYFGLYDKS